MTGKDVKDILLKTDKKHDQAECIWLDTVCVYKNIEKMFTKMLTASISGCCNSWEFFQFVFFPSYCSACQNFLQWMYHLCSWRSQITQSTQRSEATQGYKWAPPWLNPRACGCRVLWPPVWAAQLHTQVPPLQGNGSIESPEALEMLPVTHCHELLLHKCFDIYFFLWWEFILCV